MSTLYDRLADLFLSTRTGRNSGLTREQVIATTRIKWPTEAAARVGLEQVADRAEALMAAAQQLRDAGIAYRIVGQGGAIQCLTCGMTSWHAQDVAQRYCGRCDRFHDDQGGR